MFSIIATYMLYHGGITLKLMHTFATLDSILYYCGMIVVGAACVVLVSELITYYNTNGKEETNETHGMVNSEKEVGA